MCGEKDFLHIVVVSDYARKRDTWNKAVSKKGWKGIRQEFPSWLQDSWGSLARPEILGSRLLHLG